MSILFYIGVIAAMIYAAAFVVADHLRRRDLANRLMAVINEDRVKVDTAKHFAGTGTKVSFDHGGSKIKGAVIVEATDGVFYYEVGDTRRRASYEMVSDLLPMA